MKRDTGIQLNEDYSLALQVRRDGSGVIVSGLRIGNTAEQNQALLLECRKGEMKEHPATGVGIGDMCCDDDLRLWKREITEQFENEGLRIERLELNEKGLKIEAS